MPRRNLAGAIAVLGLLATVPAHGQDVGSIVGWGTMVLQPASDLAGIDHIAAGFDHSVVLKLDGSVVAWGNNGDGQAVIPAPNTDFVQIAAGFGFTLGLRADGSVAAWGVNVDGQCDVPAPNTGFVAVAAGRIHALGLKSDGIIVAWGSNSDGQRDVPAPNTNFVAIAAGDDHSLGLRADSTLAAWGSNDRRQCTVPTPNAGFVAVAAGTEFSLGLQVGGVIRAWGANDQHQCDVPAPNADFVAVAAGDSHGLGMKADGTVSAWGWNGYEQLEVPSPNADFVAVAAGGAHSLGLRADGSVVAWGRNYEGQCNVSAPNAGLIVPAAGWSHGLGLRADGSIIAWGNNWHGQGFPPASSSGFVTIAAGWNHSLGLKTDGALVAWGDNDSGQCYVPEPNRDFLSVAASGNHSLGVKTDGSLVAWGADDYGQSEVPAPNAGFVAAAAGVYHSLGLKSDGSILAWGSNHSGQCDVPAPNAGFVALAAGANHNLGLRADGSVAAWGSNARGQCDVPAPNAGFIALAAGESHSLGLKGDGTLVAWGDNSHRSCDIPEPNAGFAAIAAGGHLSLGLRGIARVLFAPPRITAGDSARIVETIVTFPGTLSLRYGPGGASDRIGLAMELADVPGPGRFRYRGQIPARDLDARGLDYSIAWSRDQLQYLDPAEEQSPPHHLQVGLLDYGWDENAVPPLVPDADAAPDITSYRMIGFPFAVGELGDSVGEVFYDDLGMPDASRWQLWRWNPAAESYDDLAVSGRILAGRGYWLIRRGIAAVDADGRSTLPDTVIDGQRYATLDVAEGWNQISSPLAFPVAWAGRREGTDIEDGLHSYVGAAGYALSSVLDPWRGYWIWANAPGSLYLPYLEATQPALKQEPPAGDGWQVILELTASGASDRAVLGIDSSARIGLDERDLRHPPASPGTYVAVSSLVRSADRGPRRLCVDMRSPLDAGWDYRLDVRGNAVGASRLGLSDEFTLPAGFAAVLADSALALTIDLGQGWTVLPRQLTPAGSVYTLLIGPRDWVWSRTGPPRPLPAAAALHANRPNPFNPSTRIGFELPQPSMIRLAVYDVRGRQVAILADGPWPAGRHEAVWDGQDSGGRAQASGVYVCRLATLNLNLTRRLTLVR